ncbi:PREDICTED: uncharacterized protein LOC104602427 [Nelumbo nucifera]|uniref:Uncharacterized protein LOC104602427 n=1 Tax=Nelumbo nucifera TaxID=4432 RepID=A0A1U8Q7T2_NELNU|nr:PREDICTED: uncharacterized protein LOC104602427 [Nelumbo nucifera]
MASKDKEKRQPTRQNRIWSKEEEGKLIEGLMMLVHIRMWRSDNGTFKSGYLNQLERFMETNLPGCGLKANPHIESRVKHMKRQYAAICEMLSPSCSGFGWDDVKKCITCKDEVFNGWVKSHPHAKGLRNKPFPFFDGLSIIFGRDRATGESVEAPADAAENVEREEYNNPPIVGESINGASSAPHPHRASKRSRSNTDDDPVARALVDELSRVGQHFSVVREIISQVADALIDKEGREMRMRVFDELMKVTSLSMNARMKVKNNLAALLMEWDRSKVCIPFYIHASNV